MAPIGSVTGRRLHPTSENATRSTSCGSREDRITANISFWMIQKRNEDDAEVSGICH